MGFSEEKKRKLKVVLERLQSSKFDTTATTTMDKQTMDNNNNNRANQLNPNHSASGPGRASGYAGAGTKADLKNHANQLNPNNKASKGASK